MVSQLGLILFMFLIGLELDSKHLRGRASLSVAVSHTSIILPFALGGVLALELYPKLAPDGVRFVPFVLFMGAAMSISAFPVLARILVERRLVRSRVGAFAIACAAVDDVTAWCILAFVVSSVRSASVDDAIRTSALAIAYIASMLWLVRPILQRVAARGRPVSSHNLLALILVGLLGSSFLTELIGVHALFGAFMFGAILPKQGSFASAAVRALRARERACPSALGGGLGVPHAIVPGAEPRAVVVSLRPALKDETPDGRPLRLLIVHVHPGGSDHLRLLARFARLADPASVRAICAELEPRRLLRELRARLG